MRHKIQSTTEAMGWQGRPGRRLAFAMSLAVFLLACVMSFLRYPASVISFDRAELRVQIVESKLAAPAELPESIPTEPAAELEPDTSPQSGPAVQAAGIPAPSIDWQALSEETARDIARSYSQTFSVNPVFAGKRRVAAEQFRASRAPEKRFIWDNVEKDYLGRTILVHGDCFRVLDDPSVVYRDVFETFTQYFIFCGNGASSGRELPWVAEVRARHNYLQRQFDVREGIISN